ncbi:hypothetical protein [Rhizobium sp. BK376]|uniref:hypothetical protein n=1 Tax=Rhizobium sp. BK376 TaxID=2512149 RepID=UPI0010508E76|nr:hypothetical protein [Rhizobium sp. BK376]
MSLKSFNSDQLSAVKRTASWEYERFCQRVRIVEDDCQPPRRRAVWALVSIWFFASFFSQAQAQPIEAPFDVRHNAIGDEIRGPQTITLKTIAPRLQYLVEPSLSYVVTQLHSSPALAAFSGFIDKGFYLLSKDGAVPAPATSGIERDNQLMHAFSLSTKSDDLNIIFDDDDGAAHRLTISHSRNAASIRLMKAVTSNLACFSYPDPLRITWDNSSYEAVLAMKAIYAENDEVQGGERGCAASHGKTVNSQYAELATTGDILVSSRNLYIASLHSIYVIPLGYFNPNANPNNIVVKLDDLYAAVSNAITGFERGENLPAACVKTDIDCAQILFDHALNTLTEGHAK